MPTLRFANRKDANDAELLRIARQCGAYIVQMEPGQGFDWLLIRRGKVYIVEIKDGNKPPSARKLTSCEAETKECVETRGVAYHVVKNAEELMALWRL